MEIDALDPSRNLSFSRLPKSLGVRPRVVHDPVESIDLYPTLVEAAGFGRLPSCERNVLGSLTQRDLCTDGERENQSLISLYYGRRKSDFWERFSSQAN